MIQTGSRVKVFDPRLFVNDKDTPLSHTIRPATVVRRYGFRGFNNYTYPDCVDVIFDHRPDKISHGHFTGGVEAIN